MIPRIAVLGGGPWGRNIIRNHAALGSLAAIVEPAEKSRTELAAQYETIPVLADGAGLAGLGIDGVAIATPAATHGAEVRRALETGYHVFVEKPLCLDVAEAEQLAALAAERGRLLMVGHLLLYHGAFRALSRAVAEGRIGDLRYIYSNRLSLGRIRKEENALWSFAPHDISMILALTGGMPRSVSAQGGVYLSDAVADTTITHFTFDGGVQAHIFVSWLHPYKDHRMVVIGAEGMIVFDDVQPGADKLRLFPHKAGWSGDVPVVQKAEAVALAYDPEEPLRAECRAFLDAIAEGKLPPSDATEGIRVLRVLDASQRALSTGQPVILS